MGILNKVVVLAVALAFSGASLAAGKTVVLDVRKAIMTTDLAKQRAQEFQQSAEFSAMIANAESLKADLESLNNEAKTDSMTWSQDQIAAHKKKMEYKQADLQLVAQKLKVEQEAALKRIMGEVGAGVEAAVNDIIKSEEIGIVLRAESSIFANPESDITAKVTDYLNKASK